MYKSTTGDATGTASVSLACADFETAMVHITWAASVGTLFMGAKVNDGATVLGLSGYDVTATGAPALVGNIAGTAGTITAMRRYDIRGLSAISVNGAPGNTGTVTVSIVAHREEK